MELTTFESHISPNSWFSMMWPKTCLFYKNTFYSVSSSSFASIRCTYFKIFRFEEGSLCHSLECLPCQRCIMPLRQWPLETMRGDSDGWRLLPSVVPPGLIGTSWLSELHCGSLGFLRCQLWPYTLQRHLDERVSRVCVRGGSGGGRSHVW